jgi:hypothetical protein
MSPVPYQAGAVAGDYPMQALLPQDLLGYPTFGFESLMWDSFGHLE